MRKLQEIMEFPKAWYRKTLVRRLFLGELKTTKFESTDAATPDTPLGPAAAAGGVGQPSYSRHNSVSAGGGGNQPYGVPGQSGRRPSVAPAATTADSSAKTWIGKTTAHSWETLVLFALHFKELKGASVRF